VSYANSVPTQAAVQTFEQVTPADRITTRAGLAFFFLLAFTAYLYARPEDVFPAIVVVPVAQILGVCAILSYLLARLRGGVPFVWTTEMKLVLALTVLFAAGVPFAYWRTNSLQILTQQWLKVLIIFFLLTQVVGSLGRVRKVLYLIIFCEILVAGYSILKQGSVAVEEGVRIEGVTRGFLSGNYLGIAIATTLPYIAALLLVRRSIIKSLLLLAGLGVMLWMMVLTGSRGSTVSVLLSFVLIWIVLLQGRPTARFLGMLLAFLGLAAVTVAPSFFWQRIRTIWDTSPYRTTDVAISAAESRSQRTALLERSIQYTFENPVFGLGLGNFAIASGSRTGSATEWKGTHNTYTQVSSEAGIPAFVCFLSLLLITTRKLRRLSKALAHDKEQAELRLFVKAALISLCTFMGAGFFAHLAYDYHLYYLIGMGVALQTTAQRLPNGAAAAPGLARNSEAGAR
jgi:O-antigen ligase